MGWAFSLKKGAALRWPKSWKDGKGAKLQTPTGPQAAIGSTIDQDRKLNKPEGGDSHCLTPAVAIVGVAYPSPALRESCSISCLPAGLDDTDGSLEVANGIASKDETGVKQGVAHTDYDCSAI